ncbi:DMT family transporter [Neptuniibacter sp. QD34_54]|uniref:DMT family transporter n=1 Tax=unclassified Neptuniibacter TaxID=2630693 RepID=UPI0039F455CF
MTLKSKALLIAFLLVGLSLIPVGDSAGKLLGIQGVDPLFIAWSRLAVGFAFVLPFSGLTLKEIGLLFNWRLLIRAGLFTCAIFSMLTALKTEPIANVFGIFFIGPIVSYFLAGLILKETITPARSIALLIGFAAVLMVVKPGFDMGTGTPLALLAGTCFGCMLVCNRWLAGQFRPRLILVSTLLAGSLALAPIAVPTIPTELDTNLITLVLVSSLASAIGNLIILQASKHLEASIVAPFVYSQLIIATTLGVVLFDEWPDMISGIGLIIIFSSGVCSFFLSNKKPSNS